MSELADYGESAIIAITGIFLHQN